MNIDDNCNKEHINKPITNYGGICIKFILKVRNYDDSQIEFINGKCNKLTMIMVITMKMIITVIVTKIVIITKIVIRNNSNNDCNNDDIKYASDNSEIS